MASGTINSKTSLRGAITTKSAATGSMSPTASGTADHAKLTNRDALNQHPISAITDLQTELDNKVNAADFEELIKKFGNLGAKGLYYDSGMRFSKKAYWYLTSEINSITKQGDPGSNGQYIISGPYDLGAGGGGGSSVTEVMLSNKDPETGDSLWPSSVSVGATVQLDVYWSSTRDGDSTGSGTMYIYVNDSLVEKKTVKQGLVSTDISSAILSGSNKIEVKVTDAYSTSKNLIGQITGVTLQLTSSFEDDISYTGAITYTYVPVGDIEKTVYFIIDGVEQGHETIKTTGEQCAHVLPAMAHGAHNLEVYFTATLDGDLVKSNTLTYDLICYEIGNNTPIIASLFNTTEIEQYTVANIRYRVYTPGRNNSDIDLIVDGTKVGDTLSVDTTWQT